MPAPDLETLTSLAKRRGFVFPSSEIYGGFASTWDYGPLGAELIRNIKDAWWRRVVHVRPEVVGLNASILMHPRIWEVSGHIEHFADPLVECPTCRRRFREDDVADGQVPARRRRTHRSSHVQHHVPYLRGPRGGRRLRRLPPARNRPVHVRQLQERARHRARPDALRHRPDRQGLPQRDHHRQLHLP